MKKTVFFIVVVFMFVTARSSSSAYLSHTRPLSLTFISSVFHSFKKRNYALSTASATNPGSGAIHVPVLLDSIIDHLKGAIKRRDGKLMFLDGTFGEGHYTRRLLLEFPQSSVIALDRDPDAIIKRAVPILEEFGHERFRPIHGKVST